MKITHLTSAHPRYDTRIFLKECTSLAKIDNYEVSLIVADNKGDEVKHNIHIYDVGKLHGRINRMFKTTKNVLQKAIELDSDIYHLHDPELMPVGIKLKKMGKKVIFDAHEDVPKQLMSKPYLNQFLLKILAKSFAIYEKHTTQKFDYIVSATPIIRDKFAAYNPKSVDIKNYPMLDELATVEIPWQDKKDAVCYVGGITESRGIKEIVKSLQYLDTVKLNLAGNFIEKKVEAEVKSYDTWNKVTEYGFVDREKISEILTESKVGLVTLHPLISYQEALPIKMFEYMATGLPVVASNFPMWKEIVEGNKCGICVDPLDPKEIAEAINYIISNPKEAEQMGENGRKSVLEKYNWGIEEKKLFKVYEELEK